MKHQSRTALNSPSCTKVHTCHWRTFRLYMSRGHNGRSKHAVRRRMLLAVLLPLVYKRHLSWHVIAKHIKSSSTAGLCCCITMTIACNGKMSIEVPCDVLYRISAAATQLTC
jgi:hypothetical protein